MLEEVQLNVVVDVGNDVNGLVGQNVFESVIVEVLRGIHCLPVMLSIEPGDRLQLCDAVGITNWSSTNCGSLVRTLKTLVTKSLSIVGKGRSFS